MTTVTRRTIPRAIRHRRDLLVAVLMPLLIAGAWLLGHAGTAERTGAIPALIVNNDQMVEQTLPDGTKTPVVAGRLVVSRLTDPSQPTGFNWQLANADEAAHALEDGRAFVVLHIPADFSAQVASFSGGDPIQARLEITTAQHHDWASGAAVQAVQSALVAQFGTALTERIVAGLAEGMDETGAALQQAADGARQLEDGAKQLGDGIDQLETGQRQLADGADAAALGATQYADGVEQYADGADDLAAGTRAYTNGVDAYASGVRDYASGVKQLVSPIVQIADANSDKITQLRDADSVANDTDTLLKEAIASYRESRKAMGEDPQTTIDTFCSSLSDASEQERCRQALAGVTVDWDSTDQVVDSLDTERAGISETIRAAGGLGGIADRIDQFTNGARQLRDSSGQLIAGSDAIRTGGTDLADGADAFANGGDALASGGDELADGIQQLADGQRQAADGASKLSDGTDQLEDGAGSLADGLQDGADRASNAIKDPQRFASLVAHPVTSSVTATHNPGFPAVVASLILPAAMWLSVLAGGLIRRILPGEELSSTAPRGRIVRRALLRLGLPGAITGGILVAMAHLVMGFPPLMLPATVFIGLLVITTAAALALAFLALWGRRVGALASLTMIALELLAVRGFMPLELKLPIVSLLEPVASLALSSRVLQALAAGGAIESWMPALAGVMVWTALAVAFAFWSVRKRQQRSSTGGGGGVDPLLEVPNRADIDSEDADIEDGSDESDAWPAGNRGDARDADARVSALYEELGAP